MPALIDEESIDVQNGGSQGTAPRRIGINLNQLSLNMSLLSRGMVSSFLAEQERVENRMRRASESDFASRFYDRREEDSDEVDSGDEDFSVYACTDDDDDVQSIVRCAFCDFELDISATRRHLEEVVGFQPADMVCLVCDEKVGEDALKKLLSNKPLKSSKSSVGSSDSPRIYRRHATRVNKQEVMSDAFLSQLISHYSLPSPRGIYPGEDFTSKASSISNAGSSTTATCAPNTGDEVDHEERRLRASFVQQLVISTLP